MKLLLEPIAVDLRGAVPHIMHWRKGTYRVDAIRDYWLYVGEWWLTDDLKGRRREYWRVECALPRTEPLLAEIFVDEYGRWMMSRVLD